MLSDPNPSKPPRAPSGLRAGDLAGTGGLDNRPINSESAVELTIEQRFLQDQEAAAAFWARIEARVQHRRYWTGPRDRKGYGRVRWKGFELKAHRVVWTAEIGPLPDADKWTVDHRCPEQIDKACCTPEHERLLPRDNNTRQRWQDERKAASTTTGTFAIALFAGIDRPAVQQKAVSLDELRQLLSRFEVLNDKRRGRCWSPTRYADGATSRANAGVAAVNTGRSFDELLTLAGGGPDRAAVWPKREEVAPHAHVCIGGSDSSQEFCGWVGAVGLHPHAGRRCVGAKGDLGAGGVRVSTGRTEEDQPHFVGIVNRELGSYNAVLCEKDGPFGNQRPWAALSICLRRHQPEYDDRQRDRSDGYGKGTDPPILALECVQPLLEQREKILVHQAHLSLPCLRRDNPLPAAVKGFK